MLALATGGDSAFWAAVDRDNARQY
jgi:hypothetical protein